MARRVRNEIILAVRFHDLAVLVLVREDVIAESGTGKTVVEVGGESVRDTAAQAQFHAVAVRLSSVGDHAPAAVLGKAGELEVSDVHVEEGQFRTQPAPDQFAADACFVVPAVFRFIGSDVFHFARLFGFVGSELRHQVVFGLGLDQIAEHLHVISSCLVSFGDRKIRECFGCALVTERNLRQYLQEIL